MLVMCGCFRFLRYAFFFFKQKTAYEMRISDWSSDVCSSDLAVQPVRPAARGGRRRRLFFAALAVELSDPQPSEADPDRRAGRGDRRLQHLRPVSERAAPRLLVRPRPERRGGERRAGGAMVRDRKSTRLNSSH